MKKLLNKTKEKISDSNPEIEHQLSTEYKTQKNKLNTPSFNAVWFEADNK